MARSNQRGSNNNNSEGRNQYTNGWMDSARERPFTAAVGAAAAVGAGVFLWSRRNQISDQISGLSDQIGRWSENMGSGSNRELETADSGSSDFTSESSSGSSGRKGSRSGSTGSMGEVGGGNASLGAQSGGGGMNASGSGRGRA